MYCSMRRRFLPVAHFSQVLGARSFRAENGTNPSIPYLVLQSTAGSEQRANRYQPAQASKRAKIGRNGSVGFGHDAGNLSTLGGAGIDTPVDPFMARKT